MPDRAVPTACTVSPAISLNSEPAGLTAFPAPDEPARIARVDDHLARLTELERTVYLLRRRHEPPIGWRQIARSVGREGDTRTIRDAYERAERKVGQAA